jgi:hypothetical protein
VAMVIGVAAAAAACGTALHTIEDSHADAIVGEHAHEDRAQKLHHNRSNLRSAKRARKALDKQR